MKSATSTASASNSAFELKGSMFTLTILQLQQADLAQIDRQLLAKINQAPGFFQNTPVIIDLSGLPANTPALDFAKLVGLLRSRSLVPVGIRDGAEALQTAARTAGLPILPDTPVVRAKPSDSASPVETTSDEPNKPHSRLITQPIRSGQQVYAPQGDLIVLGAVSNGAEVLADGNIHIYGPLRGRALAGVKGDQTARIFCNSLEAQLISVAGNYRILDEPDKADKNKPKQVFLLNEKLMIEPLSR